MIKKQNIFKKLDEIVEFRLCNAIKKLYIDEQKNRFTKTSEYQSLDSEKRGLLLKEKYPIWFKSVDSFYLGLYPIYALVPLIKREKEIQQFQSQEMTVVMVDYFKHNGLEFSASFPTRFAADLKKEIEDCVLELSDPKYEHVVDNYKPEKDTEKTPFEPLTNRTLKYNCSYLFNFEYKYTTRLVTLLHEAGLVTNPDTSGWHIDSDFAEEMITVLNSHYKERIVMQTKRVFKEDGRDRSQECIRPVVLLDEYFPKRIKDSKKFQEIEFKNGREAEDAFKLYKFIFFVTFSTQMKNSVYDTSTVEIVAGPNRVKQKSHEIIDGQDNWEVLTGIYMRQIQENENGDFNPNKTVVLPEFRQGDVLKVKQVYPYTYNSRRPRRFGIGRFAAQILEKNNIGNSNDHDDIIAKLCDSKAVIPIQQILNPQEISIFLIDWLTNNAPLLVDFEYLKELDEKIDLVVNGNLTIESIENELHRIIDESFAKANYVETDAKPSPAKLNLIQSVAAKYKLQLDDDVLESNTKCDMILALYRVAEPIKVGSCPACNGAVFQKEYIKQETGEVLAYFSCEKFSKSSGCTFSIWDHTVEKFFSERGINLYTVEERKEALKKVISRKKGYLFSGLVDEAHKTYNAKIAIASFVPKNSKDNKTIWFLKVMKKEQE